ncbi:MAG: hypothetical protein ACLTYW_08785 [Collinsella sp.]
MVGCARYWHGARRGNLGFALLRSRGMVSSPVQMVGIVLSYVIILGDFIYDFARIRPLRNMYRAQAEGMSENKLNALIERAAAEEDKKDSKKK